MAETKTKKRSTTRTKTEQLIADGKIQPTRQLDLADPLDKRFQVNTVMIGAGGIGSWTAFLLAKMMMPYITLVDPDVVEEHNIPNQMYPLASVGKPKVDTLAAVLNIFGASEVHVARKKIEEVPDLVGGLVLTGLDSMEARQHVWDIVKTRSKLVTRLVDARLGGMGGVIWIVDPKNKDHVTHYEENALFSDEQGEEAPCTAAAIVDVAAQMAAQMTKLVRDICLEKPVPLCRTFNQETLQFTDF